MTTKSEYLSSARMWRALASRVILTALGGLLTAFFTIGLILCFTDPELKGDWWVALTVLIPSAWMLYRGICAGREASLARRYADAFLADEDGFVSQDELVRRTGKASVQISADLEMLFQKGYYQGCALQKAPLGVMLADSGRGVRSFVPVLCPHCGGTTMLRAGSGGKCDYCGSAIHTD